MASQAQIEPYARHYARTKEIAQVIYHNPWTNDYGRVPVPEWNAKYRNLQTVEIVKVVKP